MSLFYFPTVDRTTSRSVDPASFGRCGPVGHSPSSWQVDNAIPRSIFGALLGDDDVVFREAPSLTSREQQRLEQVRRQEYLEELELKRRYVLARQHRIEQERQERARQERLARQAHQRELQQRAAAAAAAATAAAVAQEYQRQVEAFKRRQVEAYKQRQEERALRARQANQQQVDWEHVATQSLFGVMDLVQHLFGGEEEVDSEAKTNSNVEGKKREKTTEEQNNEAAKAKDVDTMQVDEQETKQAETVPKQPTLAAKEGVATEAVAEPESSAKEQVPVVTEKKTGRLLFTYPLPQDQVARSSIRAQNIGVAYDEASRAIKLTGLWPEENISRASSTVSSEQGDDEGRGRKRSRSPKRPRVSDVDEQTGEEIAVPVEDEDDFVQVPEVQTATKSIPLPEDVTVEGLRAELTDEGFQIYV